GPGSDKVGTGYTLTETDGGSTTSAASNVTAVPATHLVFSVQPSTSTAGAAITPAVEVTAQDAGGNTATGFTGNITVAIGTNPSRGTSAGTLTHAAVSGVATFSGLSIDKAGTGYTLTATGAGSTTSAAFNITPATAAALVFSVEPTNTVAGAAITPAVQITAQDGNGNTATGFTGNITVAIGTNPSTGTFSGTKTVAAVTGVATFAGLTIDKAGTGYTLTATGAGSATSAAFNITAASVAPFSGLVTHKAGTGYTLTATGAGSPTSAAFNITPATATPFVFSVEPTTTLSRYTTLFRAQITAQDGNGNTATGFTGNITVAI